MKMQMTRMWLLLVVTFVGGQFFVVCQPSSTSEDVLYFENSGDFPVDDEDSEDFISGSGSGDYFTLIDVIQNEARIKNFSFEGPMAPPTQNTLPFHPPTTTRASSSHQPTTAGASRYQPTTEKDLVMPSFPEEEEERETATEVPDGGPAADGYGFPGSTTQSTSLTPRQTSSFTDGVPTADETDGVPTADETDGIPTADETDGVTTAGSTDSIPTASSTDSIPIADVEDKIVEDSGETIAEDMKEEDEAKKGKGVQTSDPGAAEEVTSESLWEKTEVLAAVIACGVVGFLCALFLLLLLVYRMRKKDEGSYELGDGKTPPTAYQKAPTKEFYA